MKIFAVCALIFCESGNILGVSRKDNPEAFGLVGGKVDVGETPEEALIRETKEETGLDVINFKKVFERNDDDSKCFTYLCEVTGNIRTYEKGIVKEVTWEELFNGPFGEYNMELYKKLYLN